MSLADKPAFPHFEDYETWRPEGSTVMHMPREGLTTRQYFAALAMQGLLANSYNSTLAPSELAQRALLNADALIVGLTPRLEKP